ncbi:MAG: hypothetical protein KJ052_12790, partial [Candidatus Hydrogenedentes bacterium]|nr:hypothetical protein [Candidatus Hydrogenedentota bacterium]
ILLRPLELRAKALCLSAMNRRDEAHSLCMQLIAVFDDPKAKQLKQKLEPGEGGTALDDLRQDILGDIGSSAALPRVVNEEKSPILRYTLIGLGSAFGALLLLTLGILVVAKVQDKVAEVSQLPAPGVQPSAEIPYGEYDESDQYDPYAQSGAGGGYGGTQEMPSWETLLRQQSPVQMVVNSLLNFLVTFTTLYLTLMLTGKLPEETFGENFGQIAGMTLILFLLGFLNCLCCAGLFISIYMLHKRFDMGFLDFLLYIGLSIVLSIPLIAINVLFFL